MFITALFRSISVIQQATTLPTRLLQQNQELSLSLVAAFSQVLTISLACLHCHFACRVLSRTLNHLKRKPPPSLVVSLLEKTRAKFLFSSKCLLKSSAHTCQHWMQCTLVAWLLLCVCVWCQTVHVTHKRYMCMCRRARWIKTCVSPAEDGVTPYTSTRQHQPLDSLCLHLLEMKNIFRLTTISWNLVWLGAKKCSGNIISAVLRHRLKHVSGGHTTV